MLIILFFILALVACSTLGFGITGSSSNQTSTSTTDTSYHPEDNSIQSTGSVTTVGGALTTNITNNADAVLGESLLKFADIAFKNHGPAVNGEAQAAAMPAAAPTDNTRLMIIGGAVLVLAVVSAVVLPKFLGKK